MVTAVHKTVEVEKVRAMFALLIEDGIDGGSMALEYATNRLAPEPMLHHEVFGRALSTLAARGWPANSCTFAVCRLFEANGPERLTWWEAVDYFEYAQLLAVATGQRSYVAPKTLAEVQPNESHAEAVPQCEGVESLYRDAVKATARSTNLGGAAQAGEQAGRKGEWQDTRDLLAAVFGCG